MTVEVCRNDPDVEVEAVDRRRGANRRRRRKREGTGDDEVDGAPRLSGTAASAGIGSPLAPRASPEPSDVDPLSSPRWPRGSLITDPGSTGGGSPPLGTASSLTPVPVQRCRSTGSMPAERQDSADLDYYNSVHRTHANTEKGTSCAF